ncbi:MAG: hypothetical protein FWH36_09605 [Lentimicrobiaceae bacterium]|nr:hypothetical protein [Lentimicrobiaceae bacterium]
MLQGEQRLIETGKTCEAVRAGFRQDTREAVRAGKINKLKVAPDTY